MAALGETAGSDVCCSICRDSYKDPVILGCSHSFCRACISWVWEKTEVGLSCPQCRRVFSDRNLRKNFALAKIVESFKKTDLKAEAFQQSRKSEKSEETEEFYCEEHEEKLKLFCEEDQELACVVCGTSRSHKSHNLLPIKEAFQVYKEKLEESMRDLQSELKEAYECGEEGDKETQKFQEKTSCLKEQLREDFSKLHDFLYKEEENLREKMKIQETEILKKLEENGVKTTQQISRLEQSISEIQKRLNSQRVEELLKDIKAALTGVKMKFEKPKKIDVDLCEGEFIGPLQYRVWRRMREVMDCPVLDSITINPKTVYPNCKVSEDGTSLWCSSERQNVPDNLQRFRYYSAALGSQGFTSGRHYWEVEVGDKNEWGLGVVRESVERKDHIGSSPVNGFYVLYKTFNYWACCSQQINLFLPVKPRRIGVYLDYEGGQVSFYNAENMSHIHTYTDTFTEKMYPYFDTQWNINGENPEPLKLISRADPDHSVGQLTPYN
ncbi:zinc-binding protein A33-like [Latimeria chalumnae]|uniref:zinc-binding protein A33-like n=1 Tax=Latimeria chalumnae TaxID=7897 RepID=UPI00313DACA7